MRLRLLASEAWGSLVTNLSTTVAATVTVVIGMFLLGVFIALGTWTVAWSNHVKHELLVKVYFRQDATHAQEAGVIRAFNQNPLVKHGGVQYISKERGWTLEKNQYPDLARNVPSNPLPDRVDLTPIRAEQVDALYRSITGTNRPAAVGTVDDGRQISHRILSIAHAVEAVFVVAAIVLIMASILLISNTIRLSIFSRRREIEVMKLVGATNWFVRGPFMLEGVFTGLIGSLLAILLLLIGKTVVLPSVVPHVSNDPTVHAWPFIWVALLLLSIGIGLGSVGSGLTMRRFLRI